MSYQKKLAWMFGKKIGKKGKLKVALDKPALS